MAFTAFVSRVLRMSSLSNTCSFQYARSSAESFSTQNFRCNTSSLGFTTEASNVAKLIAALHWPVKIDIVRRCWKLTRDVVN